MQRDPTSSCPMRLSTRCPQLLGDRRRAAGGRGSNSSRSARAARKGLRGARVSSSGCRGRQPPVALQTVFGLQCVMKGIRSHVDQAIHDSKVRLSATWHMPFPAPRAPVGVCGGTPARTRAGARDALSRGQEPALGKDVLLRLADSAVVQGRTSRSQGPPLGACRRAHGPVAIGRPRRTKRRPLAPEQDKAKGACSEEHPTVRFRHTRSAP